MNYSRSFAFLLFLSTLTSGAEPLIVAHRGASRDAPENTLAAFRLAWEQKADAIEGDFHLTSDGEIVCIHDGNTKRYSDRNLIVRESTLGQLRQLKVGKSHKGKYPNAVIPTITEVFATVPDGKRIYVEVKCGPSIVPTLLDRIKDSGLTQDQIVIISFNKEVIRTVEDKAPTFKTMWLLGLKQDRKGNRVPSLESILKTLDQISADGLSSNTHTTKSMIESVKKAGYEYHVWTVNDGNLAKRFRQWGIDSITTDIPGVIRSKLSD